MIGLAAVLLAGIVILGVVLEEYARADDNRRRRRRQRDRELMLRSIDRMRQR